MHPIGFHVPSPTPGAKVSVFSKGMPEDDSTFAMWQKPRGISMVYMMCQGAGGGGANASGTAGYSGGSPGGTGYGLFPACLLPDILYIKVGLGGAAGSTGGVTYVTTVPQDRSPGSVWDVVLVSSSNGAPGATSASAPGQPTVGSINNCFAGKFGMLSFILNGQGATGGSFNSAGSNTTYGPNASGGAGGGGVNGSTRYAGGGISSSNSLMYRTIAGALGTATTGGHGADGGPLSQLLYRSGVMPLGSMPGLGGAGGGVTGGNGGNGGPGCGGGGGGGGGTTPGLGGRGGDGWTLISGW